MSGATGPLRDDLLQKAQFASGTLSYADLKEMISCLRPEEDLWEFREVRAYFRSFESILSRITEYVDQLEPVVLLRAVEYAVKRLNVDLESIDDIANCREQTMEMLLLLHLSAVSRLDWTPPELASYLVDRSLTEGWHPFQDGADLYPEQLGGAFRTTIFDEIETRLAGLTKLSLAGTIGSEPTPRRLLAQLQAQLDEAESLNIVNAVEWLERGRLGDVFTVEFYQDLHSRMYDLVWSWAGMLRSVTSTRPNIGVSPERVPMELGRVAMEYNHEWKAGGDNDLVPFIARYHHALVSVHPFDNGNGRWSRLACDAVVERLAREPGIVWATNTLVKDSDERSAYIAALKHADRLDYQPLIDYLTDLSPGR